MWPNEITKTFFKLKVSVAGENLEISFFLVKVQGFF
jgi:hypothetical protein